MKITHKELIEDFYYDESLGKLVSRINSGPRNIGKIAGTLNRDTGYYTVTYKYQVYKNCDLIWFYHYGKWPNGILDHKDRNRGNDKIGNLREATLTQNQYNRGSVPNTTSIYKGVTYEKDRKKWKAATKSSGKYKYIGRFNTEIEAARAYDDYVKELHGEFFNSNIKETQ